MLEGTTLQAKTKLREQDVEPFNMAAATINGHYANANDHRNEVAEEAKKFFRDVKQQSEQVIKNVTGKEVNLNFMNGTNNENTVNNNNMITNSPGGGNGGRMGGYGNMGNSPNTTMSQNSSGNSLANLSNNPNNSLTVMPPQGYNRSTTPSPTFPPNNINTNTSAFPPQPPSMITERRPSMSISPTSLKYPPNNGNFSSDMQSAEDIRSTQEKWEAELERLKKEKRWEGEVERIRRERQLREEQERLAAQEAALHGTGKETAPVVSAGCHVCIVS